MEIPEFLIELFPMEMILGAFAAGFAASVLTELIKPFIKRWKKDAPEDADLWILAVIWALTEVGTEAWFISKRWGAVTVEELLVYFIVACVATLLAIGGWNVISKLIYKIVPNKTPPA